MDIDHALEIAGEYAKDAENETCQSATSLAMAALVKEISRLRLLARPSGTEGELREALEKIAEASKREKDYWRSQDKGGNTYPVALVEFLKEIDPYIAALSRPIDAGGKL